MSTILEEKLAEYATIIWDWNGTLLNDVEVVVDIVCELCKRNGSVGPTRDEHRNKFTFPISEYYTALGFDPQEHTYSKLNRDFYQLYTDRIEKASLFHGTHEVLTNVGHYAEQYVLSALHHPILIANLKEHNILHLFRAVRGIDDLKVECKIAHGKALFEEYHIERDSCVIVGDTEHDLEVAEALGVDVLLVADGHQSYEKLLRAHPKTLSTRYLSTSRASKNIGKL